ncbi:zinc finger MYM-type protein 1-like [Prunus avium]|uniref:Zinc finger MYM-type protein 1-like n=1 Tax=Prunus avium TaxID=42229 RepID=A0A6P5TQA3_PRUAV|nr:zinc finger MYM-type protein 1-like [Prunus avium]
MNHGNFIELIKYTAQWNDKVAEVVVLENAPRNAKYTALSIQKQVLHILADKVRNKIHDEVGESTYCILVDEAKDASNREQMAIVLRFVDKDGFVRERFFEIVRVEDTSSLTLKKEISRVLMNFGLQIDKMRGQGYNGASNMRGAWNGLQALFLRDCPYAYYVHCFAHRLQLELVAASKDVAPIWIFFSTLNSIINLITASPKRHGELQSTQEIDIAHMIDTGERETGRGLNQIGTLHRPGATHWGSHYDSCSDLLNMFNASCTVVETLIKDGSSNSIRGEATGTFKVMTSYEFIFILNLLEKIMGLTDSLCRALQNKSQDILTAMNLVRSTKDALQKLRLEGWDTFFEEVESFCKKHDIDMPDMNAPYKAGTRRSCQQLDDITIEHHYRVDLFNDTIDYQWEELNSRFSEGTMELLILSSALDPSNGFKSFKIDDICKLAEKFYPQDFTVKELRLLRCQIELFEFEVHQHDLDIFQNMSTLSELCQVLIKTDRSKAYYLIDRLIRLVLTLPVSTATTERAFSAMKHVKTVLRNKMEDEYLADSLIFYIEKELSVDIDSDSIIKDFDTLKERRVPLH